MSEDKYQRLSFLDGYKVLQFLTSVKTVYPNRDKFLADCEKAVGRKLTMNNVRSIARQGNVSLRSIVGGSHSRRPKYAEKISELELRIAKLESFIEGLQ